MEPWMAVILQMMKSFQGKGDTSTVRTMIQEEIRRSQNVENSEMLRQILASLEHKHAAELQEATLETEKYKLEAEFFKKQLEEVSREKKSVEKTEKMKELASHLAGLSMQQKQNAPSQQYKKHNMHTAHSSGTTQSDYNGGTLPWLDPVKGNMASSHHGGGNRGKFQNRNFHTNFQPQDKNFMQNPNFQNRNVHYNTPSNQNFMQNPNTHFQPNSNIHHTPNFQPNTNVQQTTGFQPNRNFQPDTNIKHTPNFQQNKQFQCNPQFQQNQHFQNPMFQENTCTEQQSEFQKKQNFQHQRGKQSQRGYRGRGQRGRGNGRSSSVGRDKMWSESQTNDLSPDKPQASTFHIQVTKVGEQWVSTDNLSCTSDSSSYRGTNYRGRGRGRGRGAGHHTVQQGATGGQQATVKKNRRKNLQSEYGEQQKQSVARNKQNNEGDPEDNCVIS